MSRAEFYARLERMEKALADLTTKLEDLQTRQSNAPTPARQEQIEEVSMRVQELTEEIKNTKGVKHGAEIDTDPTGIHEFIFGKETETETETPAAGNPQGSENGND